MEKTYNVIVVGGQFAGLSFAREASRRGLKVLVLEKKIDLTKGFGTTGIVLDIWLNDLGFGDDLLYGPVGDLDFYFTKDVFVKIDTDINRCFMTRTGKVLAKLKEDCIKNGVKLNEGCIFRRVVNINEIITIEASNKDGLEQYRGKLVIGADGANSNVAKEFNLGKNTRFLAGLEYVMPHHDKVSNNKYLVLVDYEIAPGYGAWLILNNEEYVLGIAGYVGKFVPRESLLRAKQFFEEKERIKLDIKNITPKAGVIPVGGIVDKIFNAHAMLIGDAAGYCGPLFAAGIFPAIISGKFSAKIVSECLKSGKLNEDLIKEKFRKNEILSNKKEMLARKIFDRINNNKELGHLGDFLKNEKTKDVLTRFIIGQPTNVSRNKAALSLLKNLNLYDDIAKIFLDLLD